MKWYKYFIVLSIFASVRIATAQSMDTFDLMGAQSSVLTIGWFGEAWRDTAWCNDTLKRDTSIVIGPVTVLDTLTNTYVTVLDTQTTITKTVVICAAGDFIVSDSNGFYPGAQYINYPYKFRNFYAQLPIIWTNWVGYDSNTVGSYKYLMIVYKGLLPYHQATLSFIYGTWGSDPVTLASDSIKAATGAGDGLGVLFASSDWKTAIFKIPDSVSLPGITGLLIYVGNAQGGPGKTSPVGNIKVARIALLANAVLPVKYQAGLKNALNNRCVFTPAGGNVLITAFSLKGEELLCRNVDVRAGTHYSVRQFVRNALGLSASQVRMVNIKGEGVNLTARIW
jgi:hypothetical protein